MGVVVVLWAVFFMCVVAQVFVRYVLQLPLPWTDEVARYSFVWSSFLSASVILGRGQHFSIDVVVRRLPRPAGWVIELIGTALCLAFTLMLMQKSAEWSWRLSYARSSVLELPLGVVYAVLPFSARLHEHPSSRPADRSAQSRRTREAPVMVTGVLFGSMFLLMLMDVPIAFAMGLAAAVGLLMLPHVGLEVVAQRMFFGLDSFVILAVPLFLFLGELMESAKITDRLAELAEAVVGHLPGGMGHAAIVTNMIMAGISGSGTADAAATATVLVPAMTKTDIQWHLRLLWSGRRQRSGRRFLPA